MKDEYQGKNKSGERRPLASEQSDIRDIKIQVDSYSEEKEQIEDIEVAESVFSSISAIREINNDPYMHEKTTAIDALLDRIESLIRPSLLAHLKSSRHSLRKRRFEA